MELSEPGVFVSYRREDARADAGRICDRLSDHFGDQQVFLDVDDIAAGENFVARLNQTLSHCTVLLVVIGPRWHNLTTATGQVRLFVSDDFVRLEIETALVRGIPIIPVLVGGADVPARKDLPEALGELAEKQAIRISNEHFHDDVDRLVGAIAHLVAPVSRRRRFAVLAVGTVTALVLGTLGSVLWNRRDDATLTLRSEPRELSIDAAKAMVVARNFYHAIWNAGLPGDNDEHRFTREVAGVDLTVLDKVTDLRWQRGGSRTALPSQRAYAHPAAVNAVGYAGLVDWRVPTLEEAMSLMRAPTTNGYHLNPVFDMSAAPFVFTSDKDPRGRPWVVYYSDGVCTPERPDFNAYVRLVRNQR